MTLDQAKQLLGKTGENMTDQQISELVGSCQNLIDYFLEKQEIKIFGKPIKEMVAK